MESFRANILWRIRACHLYPPPAATLECQRTDWPVDADGDDREVAARVLLFWTTADSFGQGQDEDQPSGSVHDRCGIEEGEGRAPQPCEVFGRRHRVGP